MIHPDTELKLINPHIGYGVFATAFMPKGTIVYIKDPFDIEVAPEQYDALDDLLRSQVERYSYIDERGMRILSWDMAKFVNHRCDCNTMSTGYGFEIAIKDIQAGDEITDEYGLFNMGADMPLSCGCAQCRGLLRPDDIDTYYPVWDEVTRSAVDRVHAVSQPLWSLLDSQTLEEMEGYLAGRLTYKSVLTLKAAPAPGPHIIGIDDLLAKDPHTAYTMQNVLPVRKRH